MCHKVGGAGVSFGPALDDWGKGQSPKAIADAIINPSAGIAHGFESTEIITKTGHRLQGFLQASGNSKVIKVMGGGEVSMRKPEIKSLTTLETSLMMSAGQLGMSAQNVADIIAFMKEE